MPSLRGESEVHDEAICSTVDRHGLSVLAMTKRACNDAIFFIKLHWQISVLFANAVG